MDPIGASCLSLYVPENNLTDSIDKRYEETNDRNLHELIDSVKSLSKLEKKTWKCLYPQILAAVLAAAFHMGNGISLAYSAVLISQLHESNSEIQTTPSQDSWIASVLIIVAPPASLISGVLMDYTGRLNTIKIAGIPGVLGWILIAVSKNVSTIIIGRILIGIASAWGTSPGIVYITEIASSSLRMSLMAVAPSYVSLGMVLTYLGGWYLHWRTLAWICNIFIALPCLVCFLLPESPSWLILKDRLDAAKKSVEWFDKYQPNPIGKEETMAELHFKLLQKEQEQKKKENENKTQKGLKAITLEFLKPTGWKPLIILTGLFFFQHFSGIYITMFYSISFIKEAGASGDGYFASILIGSVRLVMSVLSIYYLKKFRRRSLIFASSIGMAICMFAAGLWTKWIKEGNSTLTWVPVLALLVYVISSTLGLLPIPNMLIAELFPLQIRGIGYSITYSFCCILMFAALQSYYSLNSLLGGAANLQWFFAAICVGGCIYSYVLLPETFGMKLVDITDYFNRNFFYVGRKVEKHRDNGSVQTNNNENDVNKEVV